MGRRVLDGRARPAVVAATVGLLAFLLPNAAVASQQIPACGEKAATAGIAELAGTIALDDPEVAAAAEGRARSILCHADALEPPMRLLASAALARSIHLLDRLDEADVAHRQAIDALGQGVGAGDAVVAQIHFNIAETARLQERWADAHQWARTGLDLRAKLPNADAAMADSQVQLGAILIEMERASEAEPLLRRALTARTRLLGTDAPKTTNVRAWLARASFRQQRLDEALPLFEQVYRARIKQGDGAEISEAATEWADALEARDMPGKAEALRREALQISEKDDPEYAPWLKLSLGINLALQDKDEAAEPVLRSALAELERAETAEQDLADALRWLGIVVAAQGRHAEALTFVERAIRAVEDKGGPELLDAYLRKAALFGQMGQNEDALGALELARKLVTSDDRPNLARVERQFGHAYLALDRLDEAQTSADRAWEALVGEKPARLAADVLILRAAIATRQFRNPERIALLRQALAIRQSEYGWANSLTYTLAWDVVSALSDARQWGAAEEMARDTAYALAQSDDEAAYVKSLSKLAHIQLERRQWPEAAQVFHRLLARSKERVDYSSRAVSADALAGLGEIALGEGDLPRAREWLERAVERWKAINPTGMARRNIAAVQRRLSTVLLAMGRYAEARPMLEETREIFRSVEGEDSLNAAWSVTALAKVAALTGREADADALFEEAIARQSAAGAQVDLLEALEGHAEFALRRPERVGLAVRQIRRAASIAQAEAGAAQAIEAADQLRRRRHIFEVQVEALWQYAR